MVSNGPARGESSDIIYTLLPLALGLLLILSLSKFHPFSYVYLCEKSVCGRIKEKAIVYLVYMLYEYPSISAVTISYLMI